jgi:hypothetical protein
MNDLSLRDTVQSVDLECKGHPSPTGKKGGDEVREITYKRLGNVIADLSIPLVFREVFTPLVDLCEKGAFMDPQPTLPILAAAFQQTLLIPAEEKGLRCRNGPDCLGLDSTIGTRPTTLASQCGGFVLSALRTPHEIECRYIPKPPRPCLLCYRSALLSYSVFVSSLSHDAFSIDVQKDTCLQLFQSQIDTPDGFQSENFHQVNHERYNGIRFPFVRPCLTLLVWCYDENKGTWKLSQRALEFSAKVGLGVVVGTNTLDFRM